jgi:phosphoribosylamine---glycine ligase
MSKVLIIGSGGREHAIAWKLKSDCPELILFFAPGNPGMESLGSHLEIDPTDLNGLMFFAQKETIDLTIVGPEVPLSMGISDLFQEQGLLIFGPTQAGAKIETSKAFSKQLMIEANIPTALFKVCHSIEAAQAALTCFSAPYVIKEDGLAAGKGVTIAHDITTAYAAIETGFAQHATLVIEEFLTGYEVSVLALCDGQLAIPLIPAQDYKKVGDGDTGPNTGGMGAIAPVTRFTEDLMQTVQTQVLDPLMKAFKTQGIDYRGVLYAGLMISPQNEVRVIEFNARFGDPETQVILPLLDEDLVSILSAAASGDLSPWKNGFNIKPECSAATVVLASKGYPGKLVEQNKLIELPMQLPENTLLFHAGTARTPDKPLVAKGGRVFNATGIGSTLENALQSAYALAEIIQAETLFYRLDIGKNDKPLSSAK